MCGFALHFVILLFTLCNGVEGKAKQKYELPELLSGAGRFLSDKPHSVDDTSVADETAYITESSDENGKKTKGSYAQHGSDYAEGSELNKKMEAGYDLGPRTFDDFMESQFKHILGAEHIFLPDKRQAKIYKPSRYIQELFSAMLFVDTQTPQVPQERSPMDGPTISSYKSTKVRNHNQKGQILSYDVSKTSKQYSRVEMVMQNKDWSTNQTQYYLSVSLEGKGTSDELHFVPAAVYDNFFIFDVTEIAEFLRGEFKLVLQLSSAIGDMRITRGIRISRRNTPLLVTYEHMDHNPLLQQNKNRDRRVIRQKRDGNYNYLIDDIHREGNSNEEYEGRSCKRHQWQIDMMIFHWVWYIAPTHYDAGYCSGECTFPLDSPVLNSTTYSFIKNLFHYQTMFMDEYVPRACCTPISYYPQTILYYNRTFDGVLKTLPNMRVATCGCR